MREITASTGVVHGVVAGCFEVYSTFLCHPPQAHLLP
jgi:hypothetical protein